MARMRSNSVKSEGLMGLEMEVTSMPLLFDAALILPSALFPYFLYLFVCAFWIHDTIHQSQV
jgi:hypothetical protein